MNLYFFPIYFCVHIYFCCKSEVTWFGTCCSQKHHIKAQMFDHIHIYQIQRWAVFKYIVFKYVNTTLLFAIRATLIGPISKLQSIEISDYISYLLTNVRIYRDISLSQSEISFFGRPDILQKKLQMSQMVVQNVRRVASRFFFRLNNVQDS